MTTIAYRAGIMACDSQMTDEESKTKTVCQTKIATINGVLIGCRGDADHRAVHTFFRDKKIRTKKQLLRHSPALNGKWTALVVFPDRQMVAMDIDDSGSSIEDLGHLEHYAVGTGGPLARAAMAANPKTSAVQAVRGACAVDLYSCLPVRSVALKKTA